jgi:DNA-binding transcriptional ArsR family regulator
MLWREEHLLEILKAGKLNTSKVVKRADMSKATTLKYLEGLKGKGLVDCEMVGPTKLWSLASETKETTPAQFDQGKVKDFISVDREIFKLFEEFEAVTGKRLKIVITKTGLNLDIEKVT